MGVTEPVPELNKGFSRFCVTAGGQKAKNLESNPRCVLTTGSNELRSGLDVVAEGEAARVTDAEQLRRLAGLWKSKLDWDVDIDGDMFHDGEGRHALVDGLAPTKVFAFAKGATPSQTRFRLTPREAEPR